MRYQQLGKRSTVGGLSTPTERHWLAALALTGACMASYLALYQWHVTASVWDPLFGASSSAAVLTSPFSRAMPVPDAALGGLAYLVEAVLAVSTRASSPPGLVVALAGIVAALALAGVVLVAIQLLVVHTLCTLCLCSAAVSWINAALGRADIAASVRLLRREV
jgi:uncharacterized membrane protein